jgi:3-hydroxyacyl-CoA dehydrogenase/enoyl-CoA hydratase/3-hydroxybutyryl-CoA epimerase
MIEVIAFPGRISGDFVTVLQLAAEDPEVEGIILEFSDYEANSDSELELLLTGDGIIDLLRETLRFLETQQKPLVALIHRSLSGLAFEVSLACHQQFVTDSELAFSWPWLDLGLLPALGTGRRLAHVVGLEKAVQALLFGVRLSHTDSVAGNEGGSEARATVGDNGREAAETWIKDHPKPVQPWDETDITRSPLFSQTLTNRGILQRAYLQLRKRAPADDRAGSILIQAFHDGLERSFLAALRIEKTAFQKARASASTKNRIYVQRELRQQAVRRAASQTDTVQVLGVLGAGLMGTGIATSALLAGLQVVAFEVDAEAAKRSSRRIEKISSQHSVDLLSRLQPTQQLDDLSRCDFVVEAVFERFDVKTDLLRRLAPVVPKTAIIASNTTTFPVSELATAAPDPGRFIGAHFFAPVEQMELLEIIVGRQTSEATLNKALALAKVLGKTPIVVKDGPGFYTSRVVMAYVQEALFMLAEGASPSFIDQCARNAGMVIGPLAMADLTSLELLADIYRNLMKHGRGAAAEAARTLEILSRFLTAGRTGRKAGAGIYDYPASNEKQEWKGLANWFPRSPQSEPEITERLFYIQTIETLHTLKEDIIAEPETADLASVFGWRYPVFRGGVMRYLDDVGRDKFEATRRSLEAKFGARFKRP